MRFLPASSILDYSPKMFGLASPLPFTKCT